MSSPHEMFEHLYRDGIRELELDKAQNESQLEAARRQTSEPRVNVILLEQYDIMIRGVIDNIKAERPDPELVFRKGLSALKKIEEFRFILENLVEAVKRDDSLQNALRRYGAQELKLVERHLEDLPEEKEKNSPWLSNLGAGGLLRKLWDGLRKTAITVMEIVTNALKSIPQLLSLKPKASIGLSGPFPTFSLQFEVEAESIPLHEFFRALSQ